MEMHKVAPFGNWPKASGAILPGALKRAFYKGGASTALLSENSPIGIRTAQSDTNVIDERLKLAVLHFKDQDDV